MSTTVYDCVDKVSFNKEISIEDGGCQKTSLSTLKCFKTTLASAPGRDFSQPYGNKIILKLGQGQVKKEPPPEAALRLAPSLPRPPVACDLVCIFSLYTVRSALLWF